MKKGPDGNRHLGTLDGRFVDRATAGSVTVRAGESVARSIGGQHLLWMLTNLLARQDGVVNEVVLALPAVPAIPDAMLFPAATRLDEALASVVTGVSGGKVRVNARGPVSAAAPVSVSVNEMTLFGRGDDYRAGVSLNAADIPAEAPSSSIAVGPYFAACVLAGETFKTLRGFTRPELTCLPLFVSLHTFWPAASWAALDCGPITMPRIPAFYLVGGGAVAQAVIATYVASCADLAHVTTMDHDAIDDEGTNLNRYCLATSDDVGTNKASLIERLLLARGISAYGYPGTWQQYQTADHPKQRADLRAAERRFQFEHVLSCVDKNDARHAIQRFWPRTLYGGSTLGLGLTVATYDMTADLECLMCGNPVQADGWTIEQQAEELRRLSPDERKQFTERVGADLAAIEAFLRDRQCGQLGAAEMQKFRSANTPAEWSVGFVSVTAGVVLAARVASAIDGAPLDLGNARRFSFETLVPRISAHRRREGCECTRQGRDRHASMWAA